MAEKFTLAKGESMKERKLNRLWVFIFGAFFLTSLLFTGSGNRVQAQAKKQPDTLTITLVLAGGSLAVYGVGIAKIIEKHLGINTVPEHTSGSLAATVRLIKGDSQLCTATGAEQIYAFQEKDPFEKGSSKVITGIFFGEYGTEAHWIVKASSNIHTIADLKGKRLMCDRPGQALFQKNWPAALEAYGLKKDDLTIMPAGGLSDSTASLKEGKCDALFLHSESRAPVFMELAMSTPIRLLSLSDEAFEHVKKSAPWVFRETIPAGTYKGQEKPAVVTKTYCGIMCRRDLSEHLVYNIVKAVDENINELREVHMSFSRWTIKGLANKPIVPYHSGAYKYFMEKNLLTQDSIAEHKKLLADKGYAK